MHSFFDRFETLGSDLTRRTFRALRHSRSLVVVATPGAIASAAVAAETSRFLERRPGLVLVVRLADPVFSGSYTSRMAKKRPAKIVDEKTKVDQIIDRIKSHRILAWVVVAGVAVAALDPVLNVFDRIRSALRDETKSETIGARAPETATEPKPAAGDTPKSGVVGDPNSKATARAAADPGRTVAPTGETGGAHVAIVGVELTSEKRLGR